MKLRSLGQKLKPSRQVKVRQPPKRADAVLLTPEHRAWRAAILQRAGHRCEWIEAGRRCEKRTPHHRLVADHIIERKDGGAPFDLANGQCLCIAHNTAKGLAARAARGGRSHVDQGPPV
jgi:hypothetical protein